MNRPVSWVVGGVRGLGVPVIRGLIQSGFRVVANYRTSKDAALQLQKNMPDLDMIQGDASKIEDVQAIGRHIRERYGRLDVLICMAGPFVFKRTSIGEYAIEDWQALMDGNLSSVFYCVKESLPLMRKQKKGRILTFGFLDAQTAPAVEGYGPYTAAKVGLVSLMRTLAAEEKQHGITVNMITPEDIRDPYKEMSREELMERGESLPSVGEDVWQAVRFFMGPHSNKITGAIVPVASHFTNGAGKIK